MGTKEMPSVSVIVRTRNEESTIQNTLETITQQSLRPQEIIIVDNGSIDRTIELAGNFCTTVVPVDPRLPYNHAYACNLGVNEARGEIVVMTNGHSTPISSEWLQSGVSRFTDKSIAGVSGYHYPRTSSPYEALRSRVLTMVARSNGHEPNSMSFLQGLKLFNTVSGAFRKDLWEQRNFDECFSSWYSGGEDKDWAFYFYKEGYQFVLDRNFSVFHSHDGTEKEKLLREFDYLIMFSGAYNRYKRNVAGEYPAHYTGMPAEGPYRGNTRPWRDANQDIIDLIPLLAGNVRDLAQRV